MPDDWRTDPRAVQPELAPGYPHATWPTPATRWPTIAEKLDAATNAQLIALTRGGVGEPIAYDGYGAPIYPWQIDDIKPAQHLEA